MKMTDLKLAVTKTAILILGRIYVAERRTKTSGCCLLRRKFSKCLHSFRTYLDNPLTYFLEKEANSFNFATIDMCFTWVIPAIELRITRHATRLYKSSVTLSPPTVSYNSFYSCNCIIVIHALALAEGLCEEF